MLIGVFVFLTKGLNATNYYVNDNSTVNDVYTSVVGNNANDGLTTSTPFLTLTYALTIVSPGDVIYVDAGSYDERELQLNIDNISIIGAGSGLVTFSTTLGSSANIFFMNITGDNSSISGITASGYEYFTGGNGKAFTVQSNLTSTFTDVSAINSNGSGGDGAFYFKSGSTVSIKNSSSSCNSGASTVNSGGFTVDGDGVTLNIDSCLIADNYSGSTSNGGGIKIVNGTNFSTVVTISNTSFSNNHGGHGGAIFISGRSVLNISKSCFNGNTANKPGGIAQGGAIAIGRHSEVTIDNCVFENNTSLVGSGSDGGAISIDTGLSGSGSSITATLTITNSSFTNNSANDDGNHIYGNEGSSRQASVTIDECTFDGVANAVSQRTDGEVSFLITNSGSPTRVNISSSLSGASNTVAPTVIPATYCPIQDGCSILVVCTDPGAPTGDAAQSFCSSPTPTVADLVAVGSSIQWYDAAVGGSLYLSTDALVDGNHYYASQTVSTCESAARLDVTVSITEAPDAGTASITDATICAGSTTTASSTQAGGLWSSSDLGVATVDANTGLVTGIGAGTATLTYTVSGAGVCLGTDATSTVDVTVTAAPDAGTASITDVTICEGSTTTASSTQAGGLWSSSDLGLATVDANTGLVTGIGAGTATLTYTVSGAGVCLGTDATSTVDVTVTAAPDAGTASITDATICAGSTTTASSTQAGGLWSSSDLGVATVDVNTGLVTGIGAGTATLTYTVSGAGVCLGTDDVTTVDVTVTAAPDAGTASITDATICAGSTTNASSTQVGGLWSSSDLGVATVDANTGLVTGIGVGSATLTYTVSGAGVCLGTDATSTIGVTVNETTTGTITPTGSNLCIGGTSNFTSTVAGGTWTSSNPAIATIDLNSGLLTAISNGTTTITYTVLGTGVCLGTDATSNLSVVVAASPDAGTASVTDVTICEGSTTTASSTQPGGLWSSSDTGVATVDANTGVVTGIGAGTATLTYTVLGTGTCLGSDDFTTVDVTVTAAPDAGTASITDATICAGSTTTASSTQAGGLWSSSDLGVATVDANTGLVTGIGAGTATLTYTVSGAGVCLGTDATSTVDVTVTAAPDAGTASITDVTICEGSTTTASSTQAGGLWSSSDLGLATVDANTGLVTGIGAGTATLTYTVSGAGVCLGTDATSTVDVTVTAAPDAGTASITDATICAGSTTTASSTQAGGLWSSSDLGVATVDVNTGLVTGIGVGTATLTYTVSGAGVCLGTNVTSTVDITVGSLSIPTGDVNQSYCLNDSPVVSDLSATGSTIVWYDAASTGNAYTGTEALVDGQTYYAENTNGTCTSTSRLAVLVNISDMSFMLTSEVVPTCGKSDGEIQVDVTGGIGNYTYTWSNGITTNALTNISDGAYTLTVTDDVNCSVDTLVRLTCESTTIPEIITPNGNGKNDTWVLELDPKAEVQIFNRWGNMIYSASPYLDDWDGKANEGMSLGKDYLPSGTYFYIIDKKDGKDPVSGYIELVR